MKKLILFLPLLFVNSTYSQTHVGFHGGATFSKMKTTEQGTTSGSGTLTSPTGGVLFVFPLTNRFSIQPEINYVTKGGKTKFDFRVYTYSFSAESSVKINYLEIPVLGKFNFHQQTFDLNLFAGPSIAYGISGVTYFSSTTNGITNTDKQTINFKNDQINRVDVDLNFGMGATFPLGINSVFFDFRYQFGISNMASPGSTSTNPINSKSSAIIIQAGISFPLSTPHPVAPPKK